MAARHLEAEMWICGPWEDSEEESGSPTAMTEQTIAECCDTNMMPKQTICQMDHATSRQKFDVLQHLSHRDTSFQPTKTQTYHSRNAGLTAHDADSTIDGSTENPGSTSCSSGSACLSTTSTAKLHEHLDYSVLTVWREEIQIL